MVWNLIYLIYLIHITIIYNYNNNFIIQLLEIVCSHLSQNKLQSPYILFVGYSGQVIPSSTLATHSYQDHPFIIKFVRSFNSAFLRPSAGNLWIHGLRILNRNQKLMILMGQRLFHSITEKDAAEICEQHAKRCQKPTIVTVHL